MIEGSETTPAQTAAAPQQVIPPADDPDPDPESSGGRTAPQQTIPPDVAGPVAGLSAEQLRARARHGYARLRIHAEQLGPPPGADRPIDNLLWGLAQPILGLRVLLRESELLARAVVPVILFMVLCAFVAFGSEATGVWGHVKAYYATLIAAAPLSPVLFTRAYAKLAAEARLHLGHAYRPPYLRSYWQAFVESVVQLIVLGRGVAPFVAVIATIPLAGSLWALVLSSLWTMHWIVIEALDSARTLPPGEDETTLEQRHARLDPPWYSGAALAKLRFPLSTLLLPVRLWGVILARLGRRWRGEVALVEIRPWLAVGFGLGAALLLAIPIVNLLFRPAVVVAASHVLGHVEPELPVPAAADADADADATPTAEPSPREAAPASAPEA